MMKELKPCPFCGGEGEVRASNLYYDRVYLVRCRCCGAKTDFVLVNHPSLDMAGRVKEDTRYTEEQARCKAIEAWNRRADNDRR